MVVEHFRLAASPALLSGALLAPRSFPSLLVPFWIASHGDGVQDPEFLGEVTYSTLSGFLFIRLIDNVMDGDCAAEQRSLLPTLAFFHTRFQTPYTRYFYNEQAFWPLFHRIWNEHSDATTKDGLIDDVDLATFRRVCAQKFAATKIPAAAALIRSGATTFESWFRFIDNLGAFAQMANDFADWDHDTRFGIRTYLGSEWRRRREPDEPIASWYLREGFEWGSSLLLKWASELECEARALECPPALEWVVERKNVLRSDIEKITRALSPIRALSNVWGTPLQRAVQTI